MPGDVATITMTIHVTSKTAPRLNTGTRKLEDTLILHAMRGKDYFVAVSGNYRTSNSQNFSLYAYTSLL